MSCHGKTGIPVNFPILLKALDIYQSHYLYYVSILMNKFSNKETNQEMHGRNIRSGQDSNQLPRAPKANTITTELKRIFFSSVAMVLAFGPGAPGSNPVQNLYFCYSFIYWFLWYRPCS